MESKSKIIEKKWLELLKQAIDEGVKIQVNHRFRYKNKNLGTFLTSAKSKNKPELNKKIKKIGLDFKMYSRDPLDYVARYIRQLSEDKTPDKQRYVTRFNFYVYPKMDLLDTKTIKKLNKVWKAKFGDDRKWKKPESRIERIEKWKNFRYNKEINPEGKWLGFKSKMGPNVFGWAYVRRDNNDKMNPILEHFNETEIEELKMEGYLKKPEK